MIIEPIETMSIDPRILNGATTIQTVPVNDYTTLIIVWIGGIAFIVGAIIYLNAKKLEMLKASREEAEVLMITGDDEIADK
jgi:hypothetical protein